MYSTWAVLEKYRNQQQYKSRYCKEYFITLSCRKYEISLCLENWLWCKLLGHVEDNCPDVFLIFTGRAKGVKKNMKSAKNMCKSNMRNYILHKDNKM